MTKITALYRRILSGERGTIKKDWGGKISVALIYPNYYKIGMSNLGFQVVYRILNESPAIVAERVFFPEQEELDLYERSNQSLLSLESQIPLLRFDFLAFSLPFENDYPNILTILDLSKIPVLSKDRGESFPLILAGGMTTFMNPEPLANFIDCFLIGEGEAIVTKFFQTYLDLQLSSQKKGQAMRILSEKVEGVYCPSFYKVGYKEDGTIESFEPSIPSIPSKVKVVKEIPISGPLRKSEITTPSTEFSDTTLVEVNRGCIIGCRFCAAGYVCRPPKDYRRERNFIFPRGYYCGK